MTKNSLPPEIIERICRLNACLTEAAHWIEERAENWQCKNVLDGSE